MTYYLYNKKNEIYCEVLHKTHMPEMAVCGFDSEARAKSHAVTVGLKLKDARVRMLSGVQEALTAMEINRLSVFPSSEYAFLPVGDGIKFKSLCTGAVVTARGRES